jgi:hypothetical protein
MQELTARAILARLVDLVQAPLVGVGAVVEMEFELGRVNASPLNVPIASLAGMDDGKIVLKD